MKLSGVAVLFLLSCILHGMEDPSLLFRASFDKYTVIADKAAGKNGTFRFKPESLHLRMFDGVASKGNALCLSNSEQVDYSNFHNHDLRQGTVSFWVVPVNWTPDTETFQVFFESVFPSGYRFLIYKFHKNSWL